jgi:predicted Zn-dependent protease
VLESARAETGSDPRVLHALAQLALKRGNAGAAIDSLHEAVQQHPESPRLLAELSEALAAEGRFAEAADAASRCLMAEREPLRREEARQRAIAMRYRRAETLDDGVAAEQALRKLLGEAPDFVPAIVLLATRARAGNDLRAAERVLRDAIRRSPRGILLERFFALHASAGQPERALPVLRDACSGNDRAAPRLMLARALVAAGKYPAAEAELTELVKDTPAYRADGIDIAPERDLVAGELALARGHDREAAMLLGRAAAGSHRPFVHACAHCEREVAEWRAACACGAYGTLDWLVAQPPLDRERRGPVRTPAAARVATL